MTPDAFEHIAQIIDGPRTPGDPRFVHGGSADSPPKDPPKGISGGREPPSDDPIEIVAGELAGMWRKAEARLAKEPPIIFQRGKNLVRPGLPDVEFADKSKGAAPGLHIQNQASIYEALTERSTWVKWDPRAKKFKLRDPPETVARIMANVPGQWRLPQISGIISCPTLRPDGSLLMAPGYDQETGIYSFWDRGDLGVPPKPSRSDADEALADLQHLIAEFPFISDVDRAVALSGLLTPVVRVAMSVCPLHAITSPSPGSGKSFLIDLFAMIATGLRAPALSASSDPRETEKRIVGALLGGYAIVSLDNTNAEIESDILCQAVERPLIQLRALGSSPLEEIDNRVCFYATGNGLAVSGDLVRRTLLCRIDPQMERPENRRFDQNPLAIVNRDRARYIRSALIVVRAFLASGETLDLPPVGSFEDWSRTVRAALVWLGVSDPAQSIETSREGDSRLLALRAIISFLVLAFGAAPFSVAQVIEIIGHSGGEGTLIFHSAREPLSEKDRGEFREALLNVAGSRGVVNGKRLSTWLTHNTGRIVGGQRIERADRDRHTLALKWIIAEV